MPRTKDEVLQSITHTGIVAIIRADSPEALVEVSQALLAGGIPAIEITMTTPKAIAAIERVADALGDKAVIGVGTVLDAATCRDAIAAGAEFVISPHTDYTVIETTRRYGKVSMPGAYTPTEIVNAWTAGADVVKVFPATTLGPGYIKDLLAPLPMLRLTPTGGVDVKNVDQWIKAGAAAVGVGSNLVSKEALAKKDFASITHSARAFVEAIRAARGK